MAPAKQPRIEGDGARPSRARRLVSRPAFHLATVGLIVAWVGLTVTEIAVGEASTAGGLLRRLSVGFAAVFAVELALRWRASSTTGRFLREHWSDLVAVASVAPGLAAAYPATRLLRLLRVPTMVASMRRLPAIPGIPRRNTASRAFGLAAAIGLTAVTATAALLAFEGQDNPELHTFGQAFWFSLYSIFATQPTPDPPLTLGGRVVSLLLIFVGLSTFAVFTGTVSAVVSQRLRGAEGGGVDLEELEGHIILCGWNRKAEIIVRECESARKGDPTPIVVLARFDGGTPRIDPALRSRVIFVDDDFTKVSALERAGVRRATTCILLSDTSRGRSERDADARTILGALTVEKLNPRVYTCAELNRREYAPHLALGSVDDFVVGGEHSAFLLAQAALNRGVSSVFNELLTYEYGHKFSRLAVKKEWVGMSYFDLFLEMKKTHNVTLVAVIGKDGKTRINPGDVRLAKGEDLVVIAAHDFNG